MRPLLYVLIFSSVIHAVDFHHDIVSSLLNRTPPADFV